jgi:hypothetical protein
MATDKQVHEELSEAADKALQRVDKVLKRLNDALAEKSSPLQEEKPVAIRNGHARKDAP